MTVSSPSKRKRPAPSRPAPVLRRSVQEQTRNTYREAILDAAERVFARAGYHESKMADVAREAGVSVGTLYNHFDSKERVFLSIAERSHVQFMEATRPVAAITDPLARIQTFVKAVFRFVEEQGEMFSVYRRIGILSESDFARLGEETKARHAQFLDLLAGWMSEAAAAGQIRSDVPPRHLASALTGVLSAWMSDWLDTGRKQLLGDGEVALDLFLRGAAPR
jgi:AcrR family transcriptional regulator